MSIPGKAAGGLLLAGSALLGYDLTVDVSSRHIYEGEPLRLTYRFAHTPSEKGVDFRFAAPELAHFQVLQSRSSEEHEAGTDVWQKEYIIAPLQGGDLTTGVAAMNIAERSYEKDAWGQWMPSVVWKQQLFEDVALFANPAPSGVQAIGAFQIAAVADRNTTDSGKPVHLTLSLRGCGNLQEVAPLRMAVANVSVFEEGHTAGGEWKTGCYSNEVNRTFALVGERDFTIPSVTFRSFDPVTNRVVTTTSLPLPIHVRPAVHPAQRTEKQKEETMTIWSLVAGGAAGFMLGVAATLLFVRRKQKERKVRIDSLRTALIELFRHLDDPEAKQSAEAVEKCLYEGAEAPDGKRISDVLARLKQGRGKEVRR